MGLPNRNVEGPVEPNTELADFPSLELASLPGTAGTLKGEVDTCCCWPLLAGSPGALVKDKLPPEAAGAGVDNLLLDPKLNLIGPLSAGGAFSIPAWGVGDCCCVGAACDDFPPNSPEGLEKLNAAANCG